MKIIIKDRLLSEEVNKNVHWVLILAGTTLRQRTCTDRYTRWWAQKRLQLVRHRRQCVQNVWVLRLNGHLERGFIVIRRSIHPSADPISRIELTDLVIWFDCNVGKLHGSTKSQFNRRERRVGPLKIFVIYFMARFWSGYILGGQENNIWTGLSVPGGMSLGGLAI